jgi:predicted esterase
MDQQDIVVAVHSDSRDKEQSLKYIKGFRWGAFFRFRPTDVKRTHMQQNDIEFRFKARYYKLGEINAQTRQIWFVLHGYGQLAQYFIRKFLPLQEHNICVIAPEALSRFYLENFEAGKGRKTNRVGATWMTRENRETDIGNYIEFLNTVYRQEVGDHRIPVTILGFSQGSATASRWAMSKAIHYNRLILWAGVFPPDMDFTSGSDMLREKEVWFVYGNNDPFISDERFVEMKSISEKLSIQPRQLAFDGAHDIDQKTLEKLI